MTKETKSGAAPKGDSGKAEVHAYQAEMQQLLHIIVHSLYSEREVFLRELISNASDAINKLKFHMITDSKVRDPETELEIVLEPDADGKAVTISDTGIGMTREEMVTNLGTIAKSGTLDFVKQLSSADQGHRSELIGQFGVGFYAAFMVAARVVVDSCPAKPGQPATRWISDGGGEFTLESSDRTKRGTSVRVELKEGHDEFSNPARLEEIVRKYSNFIPHPIRLDGRRLNDQQAIWSQPKAEVTEENYTEFYKFLTHDFQAPLHNIHLAIDAPVQFQALLFMPSNLTNEVLYSPTGFGLQLYANKVMIQRETQDLLPIYLRFLRGVVDTEDLPLNVSREMVQKHPLLAKLRNSLTGRVLRDLKGMAESNAEKYHTFWSQYGKVLKEGIPADPDHRERLVELLRFNSSTCTDAKELTTLPDYVSRMREGQKEILYYAGPTREAIERNPHLEYFRKNGLEVLYLYDQVDDFVVAHLTEFEGKPFASVDQSDLQAFKEGEPPKPEGDSLSEEALQPVLEFFKETLGEQVAGVHASKRLVDSPACLVNPEDMPGNIQKMMRMMNKDFKGAPKILELNPAHPLVRHMAEMLKEKREDGLLKELAEQVLDNCLLVEGLIERPEKMVERIQSLMTRTAALQAGGTTGKSG